MVTDEDPKKVTLAALVSRSGQAAVASEESICVSGLLRNEGKNYYHDLRLSLVDDNGVSIPVAPWLALEIVPPPAGSPAPWPHAMSEYLDKHVCLVGNWQPSENGSVFRVSRGEVVVPPLKRLSRAELVDIATTAGAGKVGLGVLQGDIHVRDHRVVLVSAHLGSLSEVSFVTDLPERKARALDGKRVSITGIIRKLSPWAGTITRAHIVRYPERHVMPGEYLLLSGTIQQRAETGAPGDAPPPGTWLVLREPLQVGRLAAHEVFLHDFWHQAGKAVNVFGRLAVHHYGGVEVAQHPYAALSGVSNAGAGEPVFDGVQFRSADGLTPMTALVVERRDVIDRPNEIVVLDPKAALVHAGTMGGVHPHDRSPFHGFFSSAAMVAPTEEERAAVIFDDMGDALLAEGRELLRALGQEAPTFASPEPITHTYWFDDHDYTLYKVVSSPTGKSPTIEWLARVPHHALVAPNPARHR